MTMPTIPKIHATTALSLAAVGEVSIPIKKLA